MSAHLTGLFWGQLLGLLAIETAVVVGLAGLVQHWTQSARWRRTIWQVTVASIGALALLELTGLGRGLVVWMTAPDSSSAITQQAGNLSNRKVGLTDPASGVVPQRTSIEEGLLLLRPALLLPNSPEYPASIAADHSPVDQAISTAPLPSAWWPGIIWLIGAGLVLARLGLARCLWMILCRRRQIIADDDLHARTRKIARQLGLHRHVRLLECERLNSPMSFGLLRLTVVLPAGFSQAFSPAQQESMLAHELAHLAASDPWWHLWTDVVSAILWWHPLIWRARRQLHITSETAADEASCVIANGPATLAECLVELGTRLFAPQSFGGMGIEGRGFQSELGRRVERLVRMKDNAWQPIISWPSGLVKTAGPLTLVAVIVLCTAWVPPRALNQGDSMKNLQQNWKHSLAGLALAAVMSAENPPAPVSPKLIAVATETAPVATPLPSTATTAPVQSPAQPAHLSGPEQQEKIMVAAGPMTQSIKTAIESKLERTIIKDLTIDNLPLKEVLEYLADEARKQDPDKTGINFILSITPISLVQQASLDSATGQPIPAELVDLASVNLRLYLPIKNVRLKDLLEVLVKVADHPIKYTVEDYGVVFSLDTAPVKAANGSPTASSFQISRLEGARMEAFANYTQMQAMLTNLLSLNRSVLHDVLPTVWPDVLLTQLQASYAQTDQELASLRREYGEEHPNVLRAKTLLDKIDSQIDRKVGAILTGLQKKVDVLRCELEVRTEQLAEAKRKDVTAAKSQVKW